MTAAASPGPLLVDVAATELTDLDRELLADPGVGGAILFSRNYDDADQLSALTAAMREVRPGLLIVADYEGGRVQRFRDGFTPIPSMRALGRLYTQDAPAARQAAAELAWLMASELAAVGVDMPLAPVLDLDYGASAVIGSRAFASDVDQVSELGGRFAAALVAAGSAATAKHFPGHGFVAADSHAELPTDDRDYPAIAADMAVYRPLIANGLASVMMAHVRYPSVDERPASLSPIWIEDILRGELGFHGCVFCDDLSMGGAAALGDYTRRTRLALAAGCDYLPVCNDRQAALAALAALEGAEDRGADRRARLVQAIGHRDQRALDRESLRQDPRWQSAAALAERLAAHDRAAS
jgi:beta-N-acetylhexosaminidase